MNPRFLELMAQAGVDVDKLRMYPGGFPREDLLVLEDFARLVVQACVEQAHGVAELRGANDDMIYGADVAAGRIAKYFGVDQ